VIVAGNGTHGCYDQLEALARRAAAPVVTTQKALGAIADNHPWAGGMLGAFGSPTAYGLLRQADVVRVLGSRLNPADTMMESPDVLSVDRQTIIQVDCVAEHLGRAIPVSSGIVSRFVPGETTEAAVEATRRLVADGLQVTLDYLGEDTTDRAHAATTVSAYVELLDALKREGLAPKAEVSVKLSAIGQFLPGDGHKIALENARAICAAAQRAAAQRDRWDGQGRRGRFGRGFGHVVHQAVVSAGSGPEPS
jgi:thiamine pyrophosphate-dependent acetolactate synthase large subunit-like protein